MTKTVGSFVGTTTVGRTDGDGVGKAVGSDDGVCVGMAVVGVGVGAAVGMAVVGVGVGSEDGSGVGATVGTYVGK